MTARLAALKTLAIATALGEFEGALRAQAAYLGDIVGRCMDELIATGDPAKLEAASDEELERQLTVAARWTFRHVLLEWQRQLA